MGNDNFYWGIFEEKELVGVIDMGESKGNFSFYGKEKSWMGPIDAQTFNTFMKKYHPEEEIG